MKPLVRVTHFHGEAALDARDFLSILTVLRVQGYIVPLLKQENGMWKEGI